MPYRTKCQAFAKTKEQQCQNKALLGTNYCWIHYPKKSPFLFLFIGAFIGFILQLTYDHFTVSAEERKINELTKEIGTLHARLIKQDSKIDEFENAVLLEIKKSGVSDLNDLYEIIDRTRMQYFAELDSDAENFAEGFKKRIKKKQEAYEKNIEAQKYLSDKSIGYFASLLSFVLTYFDTTVDKLREKGIISKSEIVNDESAIDLSGAEKVETVLLRRVILKDNKEILLSCRGREIKNGIVIKDQFLLFRGKAKRHNYITFSITPERPAPKQTRITFGPTPIIKNIKYPADQDPIQDEELKNKIKSSINKLIEEVYYNRKL